jgi:hypothetical protein
MSASASRVLLALALAGVVATGVTACGTGTEATPTNSAAEPTGSATPTPTASATAAPGTVGTPIGIDCETLITPQAMYDVNPNYSLDAGFTPADGSEAAQIAALDGLVCAWVNQTSGAVIEVAVAQLPEAELTALKNEFVTKSNSVPTYAVEGYFALVDTLGQADAFSGPYWISASSIDFFEPGDAQPVVAAAIAGLG